MQSKMAVRKGMGGGNLSSGLLRLPKGQTHLECSAEFSIANGLRPADFKFFEGKSKEMSEFSSVSLPRFSMFQLHTAGQFSQRAEDPDLDVDRLDDAQMLFI